MKVATDTLSRRARGMLEGQALPGYLEAHFAGSRDPYHPTRNPVGYIGRCVAENHLVGALVVDRRNRVREAASSVHGYAAKTGSIRFR